MGYQKDPALTTVGLTSQVGIFYPGQEQYLPCASIGLEDCFTKQCNEGGMWNLRFKVLNAWE